MLGDENLCTINFDAHFWLLPKEKILEVELLEGTLKSSARSNVQMPPPSFFFPFAFERCGASI